MELLAINVLSVIHLTETMPQQLGPEIKESESKEPESKESESKESKPKVKKYKSVMDELMKPPPKEEKPNIHLGGGVFKKLDKI